MDARVAPILLLMGFFAGTIFGTQVMRWGLLVHVTTTTHGGDFLGAPKRRLLWAFPFIVLLHPAPYLVVALVFFTVEALRGKVASIWMWPLAGFYAYILILGLKMLRVYRRRRRWTSAGP